MTQEERERYARAIKAVKAMLRHAARDLRRQHDDIANEACALTAIADPALPPGKAKRKAYDLVIDARRRRDAALRDVAPSGADGDWLEYLQRAVGTERGASRLAYEPVHEHAPDPYPYDDDTEEERARAAEEDRLYEERRDARAALEEEVARARRATPPGRVRPLPPSMTDAPEDGEARDWRDIWRAMRPLSREEHAAIRAREQAEWEEGLIDTREVAWAVERDPEWVQRAMRAEGIAHQRGRVVAVHVSDLNRVWPEVARFYWPSLEDTAEWGPGFDDRALGNPMHATRLPRLTLWLDVRELGAVTRSSPESVTRALDRAGIALRRGRSVVVSQEDLREYLRSVRLEGHAGRIVRAVKESRRVRRA